MKIIGEYYILTQLTADLIQEYSGGSTFHPLSYTDAKRIIDMLLFLVNYEQTRKSKLLHTQVLNSVK